MKRASFKTAARHDLNSIYDYGYEHFGRDVADAYAAAITAMVAQITEFPLIKPAVEGRPPLRRANVGSHVIFYRPTVEGVVITRVLHERMDVRRRLQAD